MDEREKNDQVQKSISKIGEVASQVAGALVSEAFGHASGMPTAGVMTGAYLSVQLKSAFDLVVDGIITRKRNRAADTAIHIAEQVSTRQEAGETLRKDGFFDRREGQRSPADEVLESTLDAAMQSFEEAKAVFLANLASSFCFETSINAASAQRMINLLRSMSLRSVILVAIGNDLDVLEIPRRPKEGLPPDELAEALFSEYFELVGLGLLQHIEIAGSPTGQAVLGVDGIEPKFMRTTKLGSRLCQLAKFNEAVNLSAWVDTIDLIKIAATSALTPSSIDGGYTDDGTFEQAAQSPPPGGLTPEQERDLKFVTAASMMNMR